MTTESLAALTAELVAMPEAEFGAVLLDIARRRALPSTPPTAEQEPEVAASWATYRAEAARWIETVGAPELAAWMPADSIVGGEAVTAWVAVNHGEAHVRTTRDEAVRAATAWSRSTVADAERLADTFGGALPPSVVDALGEVFVLEVRATPSALLELQRAEQALR